MTPDIVIPGNEHSFLPVFADVFGVREPDISVRALEINDVISRVGRKNITPIHTIIHRGSFRVSNEMNCHTIRKIHTFTSLR